MISERVIKIKIFQREIKISVEEEKGNLKVISHLKDDDHEMKVVLIAEKETLEIKDINAKMLTVPYQICPEALNEVRAIIGMKVESGINKKVREVMGGVKGCVHIVDLLGECFKGVIQANIRLKIKGLTGDKRIDKLEEMFVDTCRRYKEKL